MNLDFVEMDSEDEEGRVACRLELACYCPPLCCREEEVCVEWGSLSGSHTCSSRLLHLSLIPFGSWGLLASNVYFIACSSPAKHIGLLKHLKYEVVFNIKRSRFKPHMCQQERPERTAKH